MAAANPALELDEHAVAVLRAQRGPSSVSRGRPVALQETWRSRTKAAETTADRRCVFVAATLSLGYKLRAEAAHDTLHRIM